jgi:hypothetical protein
VSENELTELLVDDITNLTDKPSGEGASVGESCTRKQFIAAKVSGRNIYMCCVSMTCHSYSRS